MRGSRIFFPRGAMGVGGGGGYFISLIILNNLFYYVKLFILNFQENKSLTSKLTISSYMYRPIYIVHRCSLFLQVINFAFPFSKKTQCM